jgi:hypothetical protein
MRLARTAGMVAASVVTIALAVFAWPIVLAVVSNRRAA